MVSRDNPGDSAERDIFLREICESPDTLLQSAEALAAQADALAGIRSTLEGRRVTLTGMGSSADAVTGLASILGRRGMDCPNIHTAELLHYRMDALGPGAAVVAVDHLGRESGDESAQTPDDPTAEHGPTPPDAVGYPRRSEPPEQVSQGDEHEERGDRAGAELEGLAQQGLPPGLDCEGPQDEGEGAEGHDEQLAGVLPEDHRIGC